MEENKEETEAKEMQRQRYVIVEPQLSSSSTPLFVRALDGEGLFGRGVAKFVYVDPAFFITCVPTRWARLVFLG